MSGKEQEPKGQEPWWVSLGIAATITSLVVVLPISVLALLVFSLRCAWRAAG